MSEDRFAERFPSLRGNVQARSRVSGGGGQEREYTRQFGRSNSAGVDVSELPPAGVRSYPSSFGGPAGESLKFTLGSDNDSNSGGGGGGGRRGSPDGGRRRDRGDRRGGTPETIDLSRSLDITKTEGSGQMTFPTITSKPKIQRADVYGPSLQTALNANRQRVDDQVLMDVEWLRNELTSTQRMVQDMRSKMTAMDMRLQAEASNVSDALSRTNRLEKEKNDHTQQSRWQLEKETGEIRALREALAAQEARFERVAADNSRTIEMLSTELRSVRSELSAVTNDVAVATKEHTVRLASLESREQDDRRGLVLHEDRARSSEAALAEFRGAIRNKFFELEATVDSLKSELADEQRRRAAAEEETRLLGRDLEAFVRAKELELVSRIQAAQSDTANLVDGVELTRLKDTEALKAMHAVETQIRDDRDTHTVHSINTRFDSLERSIHDEREARSVMENHLRASFDARWQKLEGRLSNDALARASEDQAFRREFIEGLKSLKDSMHLLEEDEKASRDALETVLRTEIKTRQQSESAAAVKFESVRQAISQQAPLMESMLANSESRIVSAQDLLRHAVFAEIKSVSESNEKEHAEYRALILALQQRTKELEDRVLESLQSYRDELAKHRTESVSALTQWKDFLEDQLVLLDGKIEEVIPNINELTKQTFQIKSLAESLIKKEAVARAEGDQKLRGELARKADETTIVSVMESNGSQVLELEKRFQRLSSQASTNQQNILLLKTALESRLATERAAAEKETENALKLLTEPPARDDDFGPNSGFSSETTYPPPDKMKVGSGPDYPSPATTRVDAANRRDAAQYDEDEFGSGSGSGRGRGQDGGEWAGGADDDRADGAEWDGDDDYHEGEEWYDEEGQEGESARRGGDEEDVDIDELMADLDAYEGDDGTGSGKDKEGDRDSGRDEWRAKYAEPTEEEERSAVAIQAAYRGHHVRQNYSSSSRGATPHGDLDGSDHSGSDRGSDRGSSRGSDRGESERGDDSDHDDSGEGRGKESPSRTAGATGVARTSTTSSSRTPATRTSATASASRGGSSRTAPTRSSPTRSTPTTRTSTTAGGGGSTRASGTTAATGSTRTSSGTTGATRTSSGTVGATRTSGTTGSTRTSGTTGSTRTSGTTGSTRTSGTTRTAPTRTAPTRSAPTRGR